MTSWNEPARDEQEAADRSWETVRAAFEQRVPIRRRRNWRPLVVVALGIAALAAAFSPAGLAVWGSLRDAVRNEDHLLALPTMGRILVNAQGGVWVIQRDGSKRFLSGYDSAAWSPHGLYLAAARENELVALEPNGKVHWKIARAGQVGSPQWSYEGYRIAYTAGRALRVVNGDGTGDRLFAANAQGSGPSALAWRPGTHELAYDDGHSHLVLVDVDRRRVRWRRPVAGVEQLLWSEDGQRLLVADRRSRVFDAAGRTIAALPPRSVLPAAFVPGRHSVALVRIGQGLSTVSVYSGPRYTRHRMVFSGAGLFGGLAWSPDGRWLLIDWRSADQWIFVRSTAVKRIAVRNIGNTFDSGPEHYATLAGWCCP
jgi:dipeptidyl aminopeptidase/acylaminoacyl peptidase